MITEDIEALSDGDAIAQARRAFVQWPMLPGFELWLEDELIHTEKRRQPAAHDHTKATAPD